jgi:hypothetical protein
MRLLVTGGQYFDDRELLERALEIVHREYHISALIHGDAPGADTMAKEWAEAHGIEVITRPAEFHKYGRAAGPIRNRTLLWEQPDMLLAFPGNNGTRHMIAIAAAAGLPTLHALEIVA